MTTTWRVLKNTVPGEPEYGRVVTDHLVAIANGHNWEVKDYGDEKGPFIDFMAADCEGYHNGPKCIDCGFEFCYHCDREGKYIPPCPGGSPARGIKDFS